MALNFSSEQAQRVMNAALVLDHVGMGCATFILVIIGGIAIYDWRLVNRITLRLQAGIALLDLFNHINNTHQWGTPDDGLKCVLIGFYRVFGRQMYCFLNIAIALNLHLILLMGWTPKPIWELYYWLVPIIGSLIMNIPPLVLGMYGYDGTRCFIKPNEYNSRMLLSVNLSLMISITFIYCTVISVLVMLRLRSKLKMVKTLSPHQPGMALPIQMAIESNLKKLIFRISLYPLACVLSMMGYLVANLAFIAGKITLSLNLFAAVGLSLTGILNLMAFLLDPTFHNAIRAMVRDFRTSKGYKRVSNISTKLMHNGSSMELSKMESAHHKSTDTHASYYSNDNNTTSSAILPPLGSPIQAQNRSIIAHRSSVLGNNRLRLL